MEMKKVHLIFAAAVFFIAFIVYAMTVAPTVSFWDCGEFIACSYGLMVPHPPGAPFYLLIGRLFSMLPLSHDIAMRVNYISVLSSALTIMLLYLIIVHLMREWKGTLRARSDWYMAMFSGALGALTFAFTQSFWFNAVEAEVYAISMLFTSLLVWLVLVWSEKHEQPGSERYLLLIAYLIGLAISVHLLNVLAIPFVTMIYYCKKYEFKFSTFFITVLATVFLIFLVYPGIVQYLPRVARYSNFLLLVLVLATVIIVSIWSIYNNKKLVSLISISFLLILIGYSSYAMIYIRSNLDPTIDENDPETVERFIYYIEREQYGDQDRTDRTKAWQESPNARNYKSTGEYFWRYQINQMYVRYFLWQYWGMDKNEVDTDFHQLYAIPLALGLIGMFWQFYRDPKRGLAVLALFFMTGLAIVLYLNQPDPQPRERDYSYVGSFFAFAIWIGLGCSGLIELLRYILYGDSKKQPENGSPLALPLVIFIITMLAPLVLLARNFDSHSRKGQYIAWDYSYNMLQSCEPNAILITNGDNDTFPLWYLQEVDSVRRDVRIVNLSLLNTNWYIHQLNDFEPKVPMNLSDAEIDQMGLYKWETTKLTIGIPADYSQRQMREFQDYSKRMDLTAPGTISFEVRPTINTPYGPALRVQDYMILRILNANKWRKPIYFAVTVARNNMLSELQDYMRMDGLALKVVPYKNWEISPEEMERNIVDVFKYRSLQDPKVYYDNNIMGLLQNYRTAFLQLAEYHIQNNDLEKVKYLLDTMEEKIPSKVIPWSNQNLKMIRDSYRFVSAQIPVDSLFNQNYTEQELMIIGQNLFRINNLSAAEKVFDLIYQSNPANVSALSFLVVILERSQNYQKGIMVLEDWLKRTPTDTQARAKLENFKSKIKS
jgi:hypothetical protein